MPPKNQSKQERCQQKALERQKQKIIEDKTFGLKNKNKSKSVQKYIKSVTSQINNSKGGQANQELRAAQAKEEKKKQAQQQALLAALFKGTENIKKVSTEDAKRVDPTTIKAEQKIDLYIDQRDQKHNSSSKKAAPINTEPAVFSTDIICKHFLSAVEKKQYGWFWVCPEGGDACKYRHCLPKGYVIKEIESDNDLNLGDEEETLEERIERERLELPGPGTPVTFETFMEWKKKKEKEEEEKAKAEAARLGKQQMSGRDLFVYDPSLFVDDEDAACGDTYEFDQDVFLDDDELPDEALYIRDSERLNCGQDESEINEEGQAETDGENECGSEEYNTNDSNNENPENKVKINHSVFQNEIDFPE
ncbi:hypothetical protein FG386_002481 [Cryptosporidium ryanae]|uniref:uncharacterized protein n=1 Tax=Cryptosporidium ryanae TaxID=515981 RepID=UPI00351A1EE1|nr:hypothetical protein FG386_002481 [Cryptosporidium ryanae]